MARADLVIGSRYVPGGATKNWCVSRRTISRFGSLYARFWLDLPVFDPTGGFKVWRRKLLQNVMDHSIGSGGYVFQVETTYIAHRLDARLIEYPICFTDRRVGSSKMNPKIALEAFWRIPMMKNHRTIAVEKIKPVPYAA
jgi:dolichol-phosphate mannosyltransferase